MHILTRSMYTNCEFDIKKASPGTTSSNQPLEARILSSTRNQSPTPNVTTAR